MRGPVGSIVGACLALVAVGCTSSSPTQMIVDITADTAVIAPTALVEIKVFGGTSTFNLNEVSNDILSASSDELDWPLRIVMEPRDGDASRYYAVEAEARDMNGTSLGRVYATGQYEEGRQNHLLLNFEACCSTLGNACTDTETCRTCQCRRGDVDVADLPEFPNGGELSDVEDGNVRDCETCIPSAPEDGTSSPGDSVTATFVLRNWGLDHSAGAAWRDVGFNLDGIDTQESNDYRADCTAAFDYDDFPDGQDGIDNRFGSHIWQLYEQLVPAFECELAAHIAAGRGALLLSIDGWNGLDDDAQVSASIVSALDGTSASTDCTNWVGDELADSPGGSELPVPGFDGGDTFCTNPDSLVGGLPSGTPLLETSAAYVADGRLVVPIVPGGRVNLRGARSTLILGFNQGHLVAELSADRTAIEDGLLVGRVPSSVLFGAAPDLGVCDLSGVSTYLANITDVLFDAVPSSDGASACSAYSLGATFDGIAASIGGVAPASAPLVDGCDSAVQSAFPQPVQECCSAFSIPAEAACNSYWSMMP